jgi:mono/diheme cytochrome c family protein
MLRKVLLPVAASVGIGLAAFWFLTSPATVSADSLGPHTPNLANGKTMFLAGDCSSCHAVPLQADSTRLGGGLGLVSKFGTFYVPNISADPKDGIGSWTEAQFVTAMKKGVSPEGNHLYPAFPYTSFQRMKPDDLRDLFAYLKSLPPVSGPEHENNVPFPMNVRRLVGGWKLLYLDGEEFQPDSSKSAQWNRGAYLINGPAHCAECHSPRNSLGAIIPGKRFAGNPNVFGGPGFPDLTKLKKWSQTDFAEMLATGFTADGGRVGGPMAEVVRTTSQLSAEDRAAMAEYLVSLPTAAAGGNAD